MKVLVVGAAGQLGAAVVEEFAPYATVVASRRRDLDVTDDAAVEARVVAEAPDVIVNCAGYNLVDSAEEEPATALGVNAFGVKALAHSAARAGSTLVHYSSDFVFDGDIDRPYAESDQPNPQSVYAMSKLLGEWFAADAPRHYVLRVESLFSPVHNGPAKGSIAAIVARLQAGDEVPVFVDRTVSPTYVVDAAVATRTVIERALPPGLYHCVNAGLCTWWEFAQEAARLLGRPARLRPITLESASLRASRPKYGALSNAELARHGVTLPRWEDALCRSLGLVD